MNGGGKVAAAALIGNDGAYSFANVANGTYRVVLSETADVAVGNTAPAASLPSGWINTGEGSAAAGDGAVDGVIDSLMVNNANIGGANFGIQQPPTAGGATAAPQPNPGGTNAVTVPASAFSTGTSDPASGNVASYLLTAFPSNATTVTVNGTAYTASSFPAQGASVLAANIGTAVQIDPVDGVVTVSLPFKAVDNGGATSSTTGHAILPFTAGASIGDFVWSDANGNGLQDDGPSGMAGVTIRLVGAGTGGLFGDGNDVTYPDQTTDAKGGYQFSNLPSGTYRVIGRLIIGNTVWLDENGDGAQDAGEAGIPNVRVELFNAATNQTFVRATDAEGGYVFDRLEPGDYKVVAGRPTGMTTTFDEDGVDATDSTVVRLTAAGGDHLAADFGFNWVGHAATFTPGATTPGAIGDRVWNDANGNGVQDPGEAGLGVVTVSLKSDDNGDGVFGGSADQPSRTALTASSGDYIFRDVPPGASVVAVNAATLPAGLTWTQTGDPDASKDNATTDRVVLAPGDVYVNADFGYRPNQGTTLGDTLYFDANANGAQDAGEPGLANVTVALRDRNGITIATAITDRNGQYRFPGLPAGDYTVAVTDSRHPFAGVVPKTDPGADSFTYQVCLAAPNANLGDTATVNLTILAPPLQVPGGNWSYLGPYDPNSGVPLGMTDFVTANPAATITLNELNALVDQRLPEGVDIRKTDPGLITDDLGANLYLAADADVSVTFLDERSGFLNSGGYFTFDPNNPPKTAADVLGSHEIIFPNISGSGSGGGLRTGNTVKLGRFKGSTALGLSLLANAWSGGKVNPNHPAVDTFYSLKRLNPEKAGTANLNAHTVLLAKPDDNVLVLGFEDVNREGKSTQYYGASDHDFNDVVIVINVTPYTAVDRSHINIFNPDGDSDGDGVPDSLDAFPGDPARASRKHSPSMGGYGYLAFEDNWPHKGDYDMNDWVVGYRTVESLNAQGQVVGVQLIYDVTARGASYANGFAVHLPGVPKSNVKTADLSINGAAAKAPATEGGQNEAVLVLVNDTAAITRTGQTGSGWFFNTVPGCPPRPSVRIEANIVLNSPQQSIGTSPFNPFLFRKTSVDWKSTWWIIRRLPRPT